MFLKLKRALPCAVAALLCTAAHAQIKTFDDVVIVGRRTLKESAVTKTVIDSVKMAESVNASFAELICQTLVHFCQNLRPGFKGYRVVPGDSGIAYAGGVEWCKHKQPDVGTGGFFPHSGVVCG